MKIKSLSDKTNLSVHGGSLDSPNDKTLPIPLL